MGKDARFELDKDGNRKCANDSVIVDYILGPAAKYNNRNVPGGRVNNTVDVYVQELTAIEDRTSDFELDIYITEMWMDLALSYEDLG